VKGNREASVEGERNKVSFEGNVGSNRRSPIGASRGKRRVSMRKKKKKIILGTGAYGEKRGQQAQTGGERKREKNPSGRSVGLASGLGKGNRKT